MFSATQSGDIKQFAMTLNILSSYAAQTVLNVLESTYVYNSSQTWTVIILKWEGMCQGKNNQS